MIEPIIDVSKWQSDINAQKMLAAGTIAMYIKAGGIDKYNGANYTDWRFRENTEKFSTKLPCGYYYFFYPHFDGVKQAKFFCKLLQSAKWNLPPAVDGHAHLGRPPVILGTRVSIYLVDRLDDCRRLFLVLRVADGARDSRH